MSRFRAESESKPEPEPNFERELGPPRAGVFSTTHWSVVIAAGDGMSEPAGRALEALCRAYWYPIYVYVRRKGHGAEAAEDLTQEFFAQLIAKKHLRLADQTKGRFRTFLLTGLDLFLSTEWKRTHRQKRGRSFRFVSMDGARTEERYQLEPADHDSPEKKFERQWALAVLRQAMDALGRECEARGKGDFFRAVKGLISGERDGAACAVVGEQLGMAEGAVRVAVHRLRLRYGELLRSEIAQTVASPEDVEEELRTLLRALSDR